MPIRLRRLLVPTFGVCWLLAAALGWRVMALYDTAPDSPGVPSPHWPASSGLRRGAAPFTLVVAVHPQCPCTRATMEELSAIVAHSAGRLLAYALFLQPDQADPHWSHTDLWRRAQSVPGVVPLGDLGGRLAARFGAVTSGHALLYGPEGQLLFSGGLTATRGHTGPNAGRAAVLSLLQGATPATNRAPVFGCSLLNPQSVRQ